MACKLWKGRIGFREPLFECIGQGKFRNMSKVPSRQIVIDADVARAAGNSPDATGTARMCREFLQAVLEICHHAVWTPEIAAEWKKHASRFSRKWRVQMCARKKLNDHEALPVAGLEARILASNDPNLLPEKITKDMHLVYAAVATASPIASHDNAIRHRLANALPKAPELHNLVWVDPANPDENAINWLAEGALSSRGRMLSH